MTSVVDWALKANDLSILLYVMLSETDLSLVDGNPVGGGEPLVALDVVDAVLEVAEALGQVHLQQVA